MLFFLKKVKQTEIWVRVPVKTKILQPCVGYYHHYCYYLDIK